MRRNFRVELLRTAMVLVSGSFLLSIPAVLAEGPLQTAGPVLMAQAVPDEAAGEPEETVVETDEEGEIDAGDQADLSDEQVVEQLGLDSESVGNPRVVRHSLERMLHKNQQHHDQMLVDRFLLWVSVFFAVISLILFISQPPQRKSAKN